MLLFKSLSRVLPLIESYLFYLQNNFTFQTLYKKVNKTNLIILFMIIVSILILTLMYQINLIVEDGLLLKKEILNLQEKVFALNEALTLSSTRIVELELENHFLTEFSNSQDLKIDGENLKKLIIISISIGLGIGFSYASYVVFANIPQPVWDGIFQSLNYYSTIIAQRIGIDSLTQVTLFDNNGLEYLIRHNSQNGDILVRNPGDVFVSLADYIENIRLASDIAATVVG